ncbi:hypothetical protein FRB91_011672 [Serendipita sp. 411]|nr:hypothetical protein FRB91_011672 [Serendipita sp. 411]
MEYRNIRAPQLQRWIIHDSIIGIESTQSFHHHANCVTTLELPCSWPDYRTIDAVLSDMPNLQDLIIHLDPENLSPIAHRLPPHLRRLGISASYSYYGDVLNSDEITYNWWRDHLEDWIALALQSAATLQLVRFVDWDVVRLPSRDLEKRRESYKAWWIRQRALAERVKLPIENRDGKKLRIGVGA